MKRPMINDEASTHFHVQLTALQAEYPAGPMLSFDESSRRLVMVSERSIAEHGAEVITRFRAPDRYAEKRFK
jgi:hypothetical protein